MNIGAVLCCSVSSVARNVAAVALALVMMLGAGGAAFAVTPDEKLDDPALEARARALSAELRCMVCQNQSIDDSNAELARDLRVLVRERLTNGDTDTEVLDFVVARYGDYVLLRPPFKTSTLLLWFAPLLVLLGAIAYVASQWRGRATLAARQPAALSEDEKASLEKLLKD